MALDELQLRRRIRLAKFFGLDDDAVIYEDSLNEMLTEGDINEQE